MPPRSDPVAEHIAQEALNLPAKQTSKVASRLTDLNNVDTPQLSYQKSAVDQSRRRSDSSALVLLAPNGAQAVSTLNTISQVDLRTASHATSPVSSTSLSPPSSPELLVNAGLGHRLAKPSSAKRLFADTETDGEETQGDSDVVEAVRPQNNRKLSQNNTVEDYFSHYLGSKYRKRITSDPTTVGSDGLLADVRVTQIGALAIPARREEKTRDVDQFFGPTYQKTGNDGRSRKVRDCKACA